MNIVLKISFSVQNGVYYVKDFVKVKFKHNLEEYREIVDIKN